MGKYHFTIDLLFDWFGIVVLQIKTKIVSCYIADSKPVKQEVNGTVILPPLVFPDISVSVSKSLIKCKYVCVCVCVCVRVYVRVCV
jgi:hypothetical protein